MLAPQLNIAQRAAREAGNLLRRSLEQVDTLSVQQKGSNDFVTEVDRASEKRLITVLQKYYPDYGILAEESGIIDGKGEGADWQWVIDPLDGTTNFIHGFPQFCISIGLKYKGKLEHALIYDPTRDEEFTASRGRGAMLNGRRIRVGKRTLLKESLIGTGFPFRQDQMPYLDNYMGMFRDLTQATTGLRRPGSAALDLAWLAAGRTDGFFEFGLSEWDMAAGVLLITEAGGLVSDFAGGSDYLKNGCIVAGNPKIFKALLQTIAPHVPDALKR
jgi:myo-inositol-1(or 4)-monophosphatase